MIRYIFLCIMFFANITAFACDVVFLVKDEKGNSLSNKTLKIDNKIELITNTKGKTASIKLKKGFYDIKIYENNFLILEQNIHINCDKNQYEIIVNKENDNLVHLEEVVILSHSIKEKLEKSPLAVQVIDAKKEYKSTGDISLALNKTAGIKIRQDGSLGSMVNVNLNGLQGKAIKVFKDGIPIELFGHSFNLGTISPNMLERVEVYKGVMPVNLASDALGGGINLITRNPKSNLSEIAYEYGSFNTHRATANLFFTNNKNNNLYYFGLNSSYNYSDNNYPIEAPFTNSNGNIYYQKAKRFHDATQTFYSEVYTGIKDKSWTDDLRLSLIFSDFYKEIQHNAEMTQVYGKPFSKEQNYTSILNYKKAFLGNKLKLNSSFSYSHFNTKFIDTATVRYDWNGKIIKRNQSIGEINRGNLQKLNYDMFSARINASFEVHKNHFLEFGELYNYQRRKGTDPFGAKSIIHNVDVFTIPAIYNQNISALALRSNWKNKGLESILAAKYYNFSTQGYTTDNYNFAWESSKKDNLFGYLAGLKWNNDDYLIKLSYEYATRLPDAFEVFGDGIMIKENLDLNAEKSHNINLNTAYSFGNKKNNGTITANAFYRNVNNGIFLQLDIPFSRHINYEETKVKGIEIEAAYNINRMIDFGFNATYQDIRRINVEKIFKLYEGSRVPNIPFLFGNIFLNANFKNLFHSKDKFGFKWNLNYVHRFFLEPIPKKLEPNLLEQSTKINTKLIIPNDGRLGQFSNDLVVYYQFKDKKTSISLSCLNINDQKLYDNFNVQKLGRTFNLKIIYKII